jgi:hypothetical protein
MARINPVTGKPFVHQNSDDERINPVTGEPFQIEPGRKNPITGEEFGINQKFGADAPTGPLSWTVDILSRGQYASASLFDYLLNDDGFNLGAAVSKVTKELIAPEQRLGFRDVLNRANPDFVADNPVVSSVLGFAGDVFLDPTTYLGFGVVGKGVKITTTGGKIILRNLGKETAATTIGKGAKKVSVDAGKVVEEATELFAPEVLERAGRTKYLANETKKAAERAAKRFGPQTILEDSPQVVKLTKAGENKLKQLVKVETAVAEDTARHSPGRMFVVGEDGSASLKLRPEIILETAERRLARLIQNPKVHDELVDQGGFKLFGETIVKGSSLRKPVEASIRIIERMTGLEDLRASLNALPPVTVLRRAFSRNADIPYEFVETRKIYENELVEIERSVAKNTINLFGKFSKTEREDVGKFLGRLNDLTRLESERMGRELTEPEGLKIFDDLATQAIIGKHLTSQQLVSISKFRRTMADIAEVESGVGLLTHTMVNYSPRMYELNHMGKGFTSMRRRLRSQLSTFLGASESRAFKTQIDAEKAGFKPITDAAALYASRVIASRRAISTHQFNESVKAILGQLDDDVATSVRKELDFTVTSRLKELPERLKNEITFIGEGLYSRGALPEANYMLRLYDQMLGLFRKSATVLRPSFGARQLPSNFLQNYLEEGTKAFGALDPRVIGDAMLILNGSAGKFGIRSNIGHFYTGEDVARLAQENGILKNVTIEAIGGEAKSSVAFARGIAREIDKIRAISTRLPFKEYKSNEGMSRFILGLARYTDWPSKIEDFSRLSMFMNGLRIGYTPQISAEITNKALFDYIHGLSALETRFAKRIVPFYSYTRFAIPLVTRAAINAPGRILNIKKAAENFFSAWNGIASGETLNDSERAAIPGFLLEQPNVFERFDEKQSAVFRTFNNFTPLDVMGFTRVDENGSFDVRNTLIQGGLAQMTPFIKVPLEWLMKREFFSNRVLKEGFDKKRMGKLDAEDLFSNILSLVGAEVAGTGGAVAGQVSGQLAGSMLPGLPEATLKLLLGWEQGIDPTTGEDTTYVNPFLIHIAAGFIPTLNEAVKLSREDRTPLEKSMQLVFGIGTTKSDLKKSARQKINMRDRQVQELVSQIRRAKKEERATSVDAAMEDLDELMHLAEEEFNLLSNTDIRGNE